MFRNEAGHPVDEREHDGDGSKAQAVSKSAQSMADVVLQRAHRVEPYFFAAASIWAASSMNTFAYAALSS
jgi:hypothetical protein